MTKRAAEEDPPPSERGKSGPDFLAYYKAQVEELLSQEEKTPRHEHLATKKPCTEIIGAEMSNLKREKFNTLLRQCVRDFIPELDEMQARVLSMHQLKNKQPLVSPANPDSDIAEDPRFKQVEEDEDMKLIMQSDPSLVKEIMNKHSADLVAKLNGMQQQLKKLLDNVVTTCRPMTRGERRDLQKSIKELPEENLKHVAGIIKKHYAALGKGFSDEVVINMEEADNEMLWRLHYHVVTVQKARELAS